MVSAGTHPPARRAPTLLRRLLATGAMAFVLVGAAACSGDDADTDTQPASAIVTPAATTDDTEAAEDERRPEGRTIDRFGLEPGMCFNDYILTNEETGESSELTTRVDCRREHDGEIYASHVHPADASVPFPGSTELQRWGVGVCYDDFAAFVGELYELSRLEIGVIVPDEPAWTDGLYRTVTCYVRAGDGELLSGSMRDARL